MLPALAQRSRLMLSRNCAFQAPALPPSSLGSRAASRAPGSAAAPGSSNLAPVSCRGARTKPAAVFGSGGQPFEGLLSIPLDDEPVAWPQLGPGDSGSVASARQVLLDLLGASDAELQPLTDTLRQLGTKHPAVYSLVVECGAWPFGCEHGPAGQPARALLMFVPEFTGDDRSSYKGVPGWEMAHLPLKLDVDGRAPSGARWNSGTAFVSQTSKGSNNEYKKSCIIMGGRCDSWSVEEWIKDVFGRGMRLKRASRNGQQYLLPPGAAAAAPVIRRSRGASRSAGCSPHKLQGRQPFEDAQQPLISAAAASQPNDKQWMLDALEQRSMADLVAALRATDPDGSITHSVLQCLVSWRG